LDRWLSEVEERAALAREGQSDPVMTASYADAARTRDVPELLRIVRELVASQGGDLGRMLRDALSERLLLTASSELGRNLARFHPDVRIVSVALHVVPGQGTVEPAQVIVDARLCIGGENAA
jgi:hypothetical protein